METAIQYKIKSLIVFTANVVILAWISLMYPLQAQTMPAPSASTKTNPSISPSIFFAVSPVPVSAALTAIDGIIGNLPSGNIAFNAPEKIKLHESVPIQLLMSRKDSIEVLEKMLNALGKRIGANIRISDVMEAKLTGKSFKILAITSETQAVGSAEGAGWKWEIEPTEKGMQRLHLTLSAMLDINGKRTPRTIKTFEHTIEIWVSFGGKVSNFFRNYWQGMIAVFSLIFTIWSTWGKSHHDSQGILGQERELREALTAYLTGKRSLKVMIETKTDSVSNSPSSTDEPPGKRTE